jgi:hypothetical protein
LYEEGCPIVHKQLRIYKGNYAALSFGINDLLEPYEIAKLNARNRLLRDITSTHIKSIYDGLGL